MTFVILLQLKDYHIRIMIDSQIIDLLFPEGEQDEDPLLVAQRNPNLLQIQLPAQQNEDSDFDEEQFEEILRLVKRVYKRPPKLEKQRLLRMHFVLSQPFKKHYPPPSARYCPSLHLPINPFLQDILRTIIQNQVTIVTGQTGCGKSTQIPQLLLHYLLNQRIEGKIMVIQPRRLAAINLALSVSKQQGSRMGDLIGYSIRMQHRISAKTKVLMTTYGMFLQKITHNPEVLEEYNFLLLDQVHERDVDSDFIILTLKHLLIQKPKVRLILMSATVETRLLQSYFAKDQMNNVLKRQNYYMRIMNQTKKKQDDQSDQEHIYDKHYEYLNSEIKAPLIQIPLGTGNFTVDKIFIEDIKLQCKQLFPKDQNFQFSLMRPVIQKGIYQLAAGLIKKIVNSNAKKQESCQPMQTFLVFLPGLNEIISFSNVIRRDLAEELRYLQIIQLHSTTFNRQTARKMFQGPGLSKRKIILATNIAQSSITIIGVAYIIDFCLTKQVIFRTETRIQSLQLLWCSQASCLQRAGRTGRVCNGKYLCLIPKTFYNSLDKYSVPQIQRVALDKVILRIKLINQAERATKRKQIFNQPTEVLGRSLQPPSIQSIGSAIQGLLYAGCLQKNQESLVITDIGKIAIDLPIDISLTNFLIKSVVFGVYWKALPVVSVLSQQKSHFRRQNSQRYFLDYWQKIKNGMNCDFHSIYQFFIEYTKGSHSPFFDYDVLKEAVRLSNQIHKRLTSMGLLESALQPTTQDCHMRFSLALASSFLENIMRSSSMNESDINYNQNIRRVKVMQKRGVNPKNSLLLISNKISITHMSSLGLTHPPDFTGRYVLGLRKDYGLSIKNIELGLHQSYLQFQQSEAINNMKKVLFLKQYSKIIRERLPSREYPLLDDLGDVICPTQKKLNDVITNYSISVDRTSSNFNIIQEGLFVCVNRMQKHHCLSVKHASQLPNIHGLLELLFLSFFPYGRFAFDLRGDNIDKLQLRKNSNIPLNKFFITNILLVKINRIRQILKDSLSFEGIKLGFNKQLWELLKDLFATKKVHYIYQDRYWVDLFLKQLSSEERAFYTRDNKDRKNKKPKCKQVSQFLGPLELPQCQISYFSILSLGQQRFVQNMKQYNLWKAKEALKFQAELERMSAEKAFVCCLVCGFRVCGIRQMLGSYQGLREFTPCFSLKQLILDQMNSKFCSSEQVMSKGMKIFGCSQDHPFAYYNDYSKNKLGVTLPNKIAKVLKLDILDFRFYEWENLEREAVRSKLRERCEITCLYCNMQLNTVASIIKHSKQQFHQQSKKKFKESLQLFKVT